MILELGVLVIFTMILAFVIYKLINRQNIILQTKVKDEVKLNLLLMGKTGQGKSATGNSILQRQAFKASSSTTSVTKEVHFSFSRFEHYILLVVDGPGLADTDMHEYRNASDCLNVDGHPITMANEITHAATQMDKALVMCYGGVDAFLLVVRFGNRFTTEDKVALEVLKQIFGDSYLDHVIVVVTNGDLFPGEMETDDRNITLDEWCRNQTGAFRQLHNDCKGRFVLFNNREQNEEKKRAQIQELVKLAQDLKDKRGRYTSQCFIDAERERQKLILELKVPQLTREIQERIGLLTADIEKLVAQPSKSEKENIRSLIQDLKKEIEVQDQGYGTLKDLSAQVDDLELNLDDFEKLHILAEEMEDTRKDNNIWSKIENISIIIKSILCLPGTLVLHLVVGISVTTTESVIGAVNFLKGAISSTDETNQNQQLKLTT